MSNVLDLKAVEARRPLIQLASHYPDELPLDFVVGSSSPHAAHNVGQLRKLIADRDALLALLREQRFELKEIIRLGGRRIRWFDKQPKNVREACGLMEQTLANITERAAAVLTKAIDK